MERSCRRFHPNSPLVHLRTFFVQKLLGLNRWDFLVVVAVLAYALVFSLFMIRKNYGFATFAWDLGIFNQAFHTTIFNGKLFYYTCELYFSPSGSYFASKFSPVLFLVIPFYAIAPSPDMLLIFKSFTLALGALPLYFLSKEVIGSKKAGFVMAVAYLLNPGIQSSNTFDFQQQIFIPITIFSSYYFMTKKRLKLYFLFVLLSLMIEEHVAMILFVMSFFQFLSISRLKTLAQDIKMLHFPKPSRTSTVLLGTMAFSASWYFIARLARAVYPIAPQFAEIYNASGNHSVLGFTGDALSLPIYVLMNPQRSYNALAYDFHLKFLYLLILFAPLAFLSFRSRLSLAAAVLLAPFLLSNYEPYYVLGAHYPLYLVPLIILGAVEGLRNFAREGKNALTTNVKGTPVLRSIIIASLIFMIALSPLSPLSQAFVKVHVLWYAQPYSSEDYVKTLHEMINMVPSDASILTQNNLFPHFSNRINAYVVPVVKTSSDSANIATENYIRQEINESDYVLLDSIDIEPWADFVLSELSTSDSFKIRAIGGSAILFMKHYNGSSFFVPKGDYEVFLGHSDFMTSSTQSMNDPTSNTGYVVYSEKGSKPNFFVYGPYVFLPPGTFSVSFEVRVGKHDEGYLGTMDVSNNVGKSILCKRDMYGFNIPVNTWTNYTLSLTTTELRTAVEFRIFTSGAADIYLDRVIVRKASQSAEENFGTYTYSQEGLYLGPCQLTSDGLIVWKHNQSSTFLWYGPYITLPPGTYKTTFFVRASSPLENPNQRMLTLQVTSLAGSNLLASEDVYSSNLFNAENVSSWHGFTLEFTCDHEVTNVEFRGANPSYDVDIYLGFILVERVA